MQEAQWSPVADLFLHSADFVQDTTMMLAQVTGLEYGDFIHTFGDAHIYSNHMDQIELQLSRDPKPLPKMIINPEIKNIFEFSFKDFNLVDYEPHPLIRGKVSV